jgi:hypothetical protein
MLHVWNKQELGTKFWLENIKGRAHLGDLSVDGKIILTWS